MVYLFQVTAVFSVLYILYILFLEKLTFHTLNRFVLLILIPVSCLIPFSNLLFPSIASNIVDIPIFDQVSIERINQQLQFIKQPIKATSLNISIVFLILYWILVALHFIRIFTNINHLFALRQTGLIEQNKGFQLIITNVPETFSYFNWVFIPKNSQRNTVILKHEMTHINLKHSWDVLLTEVFIAFFWFNPLLYLYRKSQKSIHEFQADKNVLESGIKTSRYMQLLLQSIEIHKPNNLYNYFNQPILKKRATMMTKPTSKQLSKLIYLLPLVVCIFLISAFAKPIEENYLFLEHIDVAKNLQSTPSLFPVKNGTKKDITSHFGALGKHPKLNKGIIHKGIDIKAIQGTPVFATADGVIARSSMEGDWGNLIVISHSDGYTTWYAHLNGFNSEDKQTVKKGDIIGYVGTTGRSTGYHLHYEVKQNGQNLNPLAYIE
jgi:murein DD-endopeptidase MepM/ murein hydrolase activator NlpD